MAGNHWCPCPLVSLSSDEANTHLLRGPALGISFRTVNVAVFLWSSSQMNHSFGDTQPYKSMQWIKTGPARSKQKPKLSGFLSSNSQGSKTALGFPKRTAWVAPARQHTGLKWGQTTLGDSHDALEMSTAALQCLRSSAAFWAMGIDFGHCFSGKLKVCAPLQLVRHSGPPFNRGLRPSSLGRARCLWKQSEALWGLFLPSPRLGSMAQPDYVSFL